MINAIFLAFALHYFLRTLGVNKFGYFLTGAVFFSGISGLAIEHLFGQASYGMYFGSSVLLASFGLRYLEKKSTYSAIGGIFLILLMQVWGNPSRSFIYLIAPLLGSIALFIHTSKSIICKRHYFLVIAMLASAAIGYFLHSYSIEHSNALSSRSINVDFPNNFIPRISHLIQEVFWLMGARGEGLYIDIKRGLIFIAIILFMYFLIDFFRNINDKQSQSYNFIFLYCLISLLGVLAAITSTSVIADLVLDASRARYLLIPVIFFIILISVRIASDYRLPNFNKKLVLALLSLYAISGVDNYFFQGKSSERVDAAFLESVVSSDERLFKGLKEKGLSYGYSNFWNAGRNTVLTDSDIKIRSIEIRNGVPEPHRWLADDAWYTPDAWDGKTFLMLTREDAGKIDKKALLDQGAKISEEFYLENFKVLLFEENLSKFFPEWSNAREGNMPVHMNSLHSIGEIKYVENKYLISSRPGDVGFLHYGPYVNLPKGKYSVEFDIDSISNGDYLLDVNVDNKNIFRQNPGSRVIYFEIVKKSSVEFRVETTGKGWVNYYGVSLRHAE